VPDFFLSEAAKEDLAHIWRYHAEHATIEIADGLVDRLGETIGRTIQRFPNSGRSRQELGRGVRSHPILPFVVFYRTHNRRVLVLRVLHGNRDIRAPLMSLLVSAISSSSVRAS
jgi:toxin ParE1/3/4